MTLQEYADLHDEGKRLRPEIIEAMAQADEEGGPMSWWVEYEIPAETNGWVYVGNPGAASTTHYWADRHPDPTEAVIIHHTPTHPRDETPDVLRVRYRDDFEGAETFHDDEIITEIEGEPYRTPLYTKRRMFWEGVEAAVEWMENNPPSDG